MDNLNLTLLAFLCILASYQTRGNITVKGTIFFTGEMDTPKRIVVMIKRNGTKKPNASKSLPINWDQCTQVNQATQCEYSVNKLYSEFDQKYAVGIAFQYDHAKDREIWTGNILKNLKKDVNKQNIFYDIRNHPSEIQLEPGPWMESPTNGEGRRTNVVKVHGTVDVTLQTIKPDGVFILFKLDGEKTDYEAKISWEICSDRKCKYSIDNVHAHHGQTFSVGVTHYGEDKKYDDRRKNVVWVKGANALKEGENTMDIKYYTGKTRITEEYRRVFMEHFKTDPTVAKAFVISQMSLVGTINVVTLPNDRSFMAVMVYIRETFDGYEPLYSSLINWPSDCSENKCQYEIKHVPAHIGQNYVLGASLVHIDFGGNRLFTTIKTGKSVYKDKAFAKDGENRQNLQYDVATEKASLKFV